MASLFWIGGTNSNWSQTGNWSTTSGGGSSGTIPGATTDVFFDNNSNTRACIQNLSNSCQSLTFQTGYTQTFSQNALLTISSGGVTCQSGTYAFNSGAAGAWVFNTACGITCGGKVGNINFRFTSNTTTYTLNDAFACHNADFGSALGPATFSGAFDMSIGGGFSLIGAGANAITFSQNVTVTGLTTVTGGAVVNGTGTFTTNGGMTIAGNSGGDMTGTMSFVWPSGTTVSWGQQGAWGYTTTFTSVTFTTTLTGNAVRFYNGKTFTCTSGSTTVSLPLIMKSGVTLNTPNATWSTVQTTTAQTTTLNGAFTTTGTWTHTTGNLSVAGTNGFTLGGALIFTPTTASTCTLKFGNTYVINGIQNLGSTSGTRFKVLSDTGGSQVVLKNTGFSQCYFLDATDVDSSGGSTIWSFGSTTTLSNTANWNKFTDVTSFARGMIS